MLQHDAFLKSIGMVTNVNKTELIYFSRIKTEDTAALQVGQDFVTPKKSMKVLILLISKEWKRSLCWIMH